jgi:hypothetical protein
MTRTVHILFYGLAGIALLGPVIVAGFSSSNAMPVILQFLPSSLIQALFLAAIGTAYAAVRRHAPSGTVAGLGMAHAVAALLGLIASFAGQFFQGRLYSDGSTSQEAGQIGIAFGLAGLFSSIAGLLFLIAMIIALNTKPRAADTFS